MRSQTGDALTSPSTSSPPKAGSPALGVASSSSEAGAHEASEDAGAELEGELMDGEEAADEETLTEQSSTKKHKHNIAERVRSTCLHNPPVFAHACTRCSCERLPHIPVPFPAHSGAHRGSIVSSRSWECLPTTC